MSTGQHPGSAEVDRVLPNRVDRLEVPVAGCARCRGCCCWSHRAATLAGSVQPSSSGAAISSRPAIPPLDPEAAWSTPYGIVLYGTDLLLLRHRIRHSALKRAGARTLIGSASVLVAISRWTRDEALSLLEELGLHGRGDVRLLPFGTDPEHFRPGVDPSAVRARYGLVEGRWLLTVARLAAHKGIDTVLQVLAGLRGEYPDLRYLVVGRGDRLRDLEGLARNLGVTDRVRFLTDVPDADLPALYNTAEIYMGLSRPAGLMVEGFGISLSEASASGIPVIGGSGGGIPDAVRDGETGFLVKAEGAEAATAAVRKLLGDRELGRRLGAEGRRAVETYYNWERVTSELAGIGHELGRICPSGGGAVNIETAPQPSTGSDYDQQYRTWLDHQGPRGLDLDWRMRHLLWRQRVLLRRFPSDRKRVLDFGCMDGIFTLRLQQLGAEAVGYDISAAAISQAEKFRGAAPHPVFTTVPPGPGQFDMVFCNEVIEHVRDDAALVGQLVEFLAPGGVLVGTTPVGKHFGDPDHKHQYDLNTLDRALSSWGRTRIRRYYRTPLRNLLPFRQEGAAVFIFEVRPQSLRDAR